MEEKPAPLKTTRVRHPRLLHIDVRAELDGSVVRFIFRLIHGVCESGDSPFISKHDQPTHDTNLRFWIRHQILKQSEKIIL